MSWQVWSICWDDAIAFCLVQMSTLHSPFDDFVDDCFLEEDPLCNKSREQSLELIASQLISGLVTEDEEQMAA